MAADITLWSEDYGQRLEINTWCAEIATATEFAVRFMRISTRQTLQLSATAVPLGDLDNPDKRAIVCTIPAKWLKDKLGRWRIQPRAKWGDAWISGDPLILEVKRHPTVTTTTTSTTSTTSTTTV